MKEKCGVMGHYGSTIYLRQPPCGLDRFILATDLDIPKLVRLEFTVLYVSDIFSIYSITYLYSLESSIFSQQSSASTSGRVSFVYEL